MVEALVILAALVFASPQSPSDQPYELKGEAPGITLKQFKANHSHSDCSNLTSRKTSCRVYEGVSFAGIIATTHKGCGLPECAGQGILADFFDGKLVSLSYGLSPGSRGAIVAALKKKFGEPTENTPSLTTWKNSVGYLSVFELVVFKDGSKNYIVTTITSALNDQGGGKDI